MTDLNSEEHKEDLEKESAFSAASPQAPAAAEGEETAAAPEEVSAPSPAPAETAAAESQAKDAEKPAEKQEEAEPVKGGPAEETNAVKESDPTPKAKKKKASKRKKKEKLSIPALICAIVSFSLLYYWSACIVPRLGENINPHDKSFTQKILVLINKAKYKFGQDKTPPPAPPQNLNQQSAGSGAPPPPDGNQPPADNGAPPPSNGNQPPGPPNNAAPPPPNGNQPPGPPNNGAQPPQNGNQPPDAK